MCSRCAVAGPAARGRSAARTSHNAARIEATVKPAGSPMLCREIAGRSVNAMSPTRLPPLTPFQNAPGAVWSARGKAASGDRDTALSPARSAVLPCLGRLRRGRKRRRRARLRPLPPHSILRQAYPGAWRQRGARTRRAQTRRTPPTVMLSNPVAATIGSPRASADARQRNNRATAHNPEISIRGLMCCSA
jgi:hypothetical protein